MSNSSDILSSTETLLTVSAAASRLSVSRRTLERLICAGTFPRPLKIGRAVRVAPTDVTNYLEKLHRERVSGLN